MHRNSVYKELDLDKFEVSTALRKERTRDYDKEPLVLRDYSGFPLILHYLIILIFWITTSGFCISCLDDFESGILDFDDTKRTIIKFGFAIVVFLIFDCFNIINLNIATINGCNKYIARHSCPSNTNNLFDSFFSFDIKTI